MAHCTGTLHCTSGPLQCAPVQCAFYKARVVSVCPLDVRELRPNSTGRCVCLFREARNMDPELRYGRAYVPRTNYSYITTTNLARNKSKPSTRSYSVAPALDRDWTPSKTDWMPKRDWYYGAYEDLYAPSSSLKSRLKSEDTNVSSRRLKDDINYELNRFKAPERASINTHPIKRHRQWEHDDWQDKMDLLYPYTKNLSYRDQLAQDSYSGGRLSRHAANDRAKDQLNDLNYDYNVLRRGNLNDYPALPRNSIYHSVSKQPSLYDDVGHYMFPSAYPIQYINFRSRVANGKPLKNLSYLDTHEDWLKTMSHDLYPPRRYFSFPENRSSSVRPAYKADYGMHSKGTYTPRATDSSRRGKSSSPSRRTPSKSYTAPSYPAYEKTPLRSYSPPARTSDYVPKSRKVTYDDEPASTRPRRANREVSPSPERPARPARQASKPADEEVETPKRRPRYEPEPEADQPSLEKRRIPSVTADEPEEPAKPASKRPSVTEVKVPTPTPSPRPSVADEEEPEKSVPASSRRSVTELPKSKTPTPKGPTPKASVTETPRESVSEPPQTPVAKTPRESVAETPRASVAKTPRESVAETPRASVAQTPKASVAESPRASETRTPRESLADAKKSREPSPGPSESEVFEEEAPAAEEEEPAVSEREVTPVPEPEEPEPVSEREATPVPEEAEAEAETAEAEAEEEREPSPAPADEEPAAEEEEEAPQRKLKRNTSEEFAFDDEAAEEAPAENGDADQPEEDFEWGAEQVTSKVTQVITGGTTTTKVTTTRTETTYEEEEVEEYTETIEEDGAEEPSQLEYGEEEDLNAQSIKERGFSRENSTGSAINGEDEEEEE
ncbi:hypothetical protein BV898_16889 [Hypsibius exemplaris]|uniref:Uncharacterized protein n=1 Tax=Hypsibius exemplaris TaxID=2072580 RepID=A0A9X6NGR7_HYPEX|nr:hypothetical protein BV898_16889 [Hypsibius exemplaris]